VNSLPKTVTQQRCGCDLNPGRTAPESSTLTSPLSIVKHRKYIWREPRLFDSWQQRCREAAFVAGQ